jgi:hypothetical protein
MNKKISKIITGISILGCLGIFLPSQGLADKDPCAALEVTDCTKYKISCVLRPGKCSGPDCEGRVNERLCERVEGCKWNPQPYCKAKIECPNVDSDKHCDKLSSCKWENNACTYKPLS